MRPLQCIFRADHASNAAQKAPMTNKRDFLVKRKKGLYIFHSLHCQVKCKKFYGNFSPQLDAKTHLARTIHQMGMPFWKNYLHIQLCGMQSKGKNHHFPQQHKRLFCNTYTFKCLYFFFPNPWHPVMHGFTSDTMVQRIRIAILCEPNHKVQ